MDSCTCAFVLFTLLVIRNEQVDNFANIIKQDTATQLMQYYLLVQLSSSSFNTSFSFFASSLMSTELPELLCLLT